MSSRIPGWDQISEVLRPDAAARSRVLELSPARFPILDFEPWRGGTFYDASPFEYAADPTWKANPALIRLLDRVGHVTRALDLGCGCGRSHHALTAHADIIVAVDQSLASLRVACTAHPVRGVRVSALALPFENASFALAICEGVAHCTGDMERTIAELVRVLQPGGHAFVSVYIKGSGYELAWSFLGGLLRAAGCGTVRENASWFARAVDAAAFAGYRLASLILKRGRTTDVRALRAIYDDYFLTPVVSFHSETELRALMERLGCEVEDVSRHNNVWTLAARRR